MILTDHISLLMIMVIVAVVTGVSVHENATQMDKLLLISHPNLANSRKLSD